MPGPLVQRPAAVLRFMIRLEDDGPAQDDEAQSEYDPFQHKVADMNKQRASLNRRLGEARAAGDEARETRVKKELRRVNKQLEIAKSGQPSPQGAPDDFFNLKDLVVVPTDLSVELNGFRTADKLTATFPFAALPLTSRIIRSCLVEAYLGTVPAEAFSDPSNWGLPFDRTTIIFRGYVDEWKTDHNEDHAEVRIEARSMEAILIDQKVNKNARIFQVGRIESSPAAAGTVGGLKVGSDTTIAGQNPGLLVEGNINLNTRPHVVNEDGSVSTVRSFSFEEDGVEVLVPTVTDDGRIVSEDEAIAIYKSNGKFLGKFDTPAHATSYAHRLHDQQAGTLTAPKGKTQVLDSELITYYLNRFFSALPNVNGALGGDTLTAKWNGRGKEPSVSRKLFMRAMQTAKSQNQALGGTPGQMAPPPPQPTTPEEPGTTEGVGQAAVPQPHAQCDTSAWDIVTIACELVGCIPIYDPSVDPDAIIIQLPQTVYDDEGQSKNPQDGFIRKLTDPDTGNHVTTPFRLMVWGRNVKEMSTSRKLGHVKAPAVEVVAYNCDAAPDKRQIRVRFPDTKRATRVGAEGKGKTEEVITKVVRSVRSEEELRQIAVAIYHSIGRHETTVRLVTDSMVSYSDPGIIIQDPDLLRLRPGAAVRVLVARYSEDVVNGLNLTPLSDAFGQDPSQIRAFLADQFKRNSKLAPQEQAGKVEQMATRIAAVATEQRSRNLYYVRTCNHKFNKDAGWRLEAEVATFARATTDPARMAQKDKTTNDRRKVPQKPRGSKPTKTPAQIAADRAATVHGTKEME